MANLLNQLQQVQQQRAATPEAGNVERLRSMLATKATGKVGQVSGPRVSSVAEQAALGEQRAAAEQLQQRGEQAVAAQQLQEQAQQQQFDIRSRELQRQREANLAQFNRQADNIARNLERSDRTRRTDRDMFDLATLGQTQALQDRRYMDDLSREGNRRRLDDNINFKQELQESVFSDQKDLLANQLDFRQMMDMDQEDFRREVAKIDLNTAEQLVRNDIAAANQRMLYEGLSGVVSGGIQAYGQYTEEGTS